jgi:hypothetical protein
LVIAQKLEDLFDNCPGLEQQNLPKTIVKRAISIGVRFAEHPFQNISSANGRIVGLISTIK